MRRLILTVFVLCAASVISFSCAAIPVNVPLPAARSEAANIKLNPALPMINTEVAITCQLPTEVQYGRYIFGVTDVFSSEASIDSSQIVRKVRIGCFPIHVYCGYQEYSKELGWREPKGVMLDVTPVGDCSNE